MPDSQFAAGILGAAAASTRYADAPVAVRQRAVDVFVDTIAAMAVGSDSPTHVRLQQAFSAGSGGATVIGRAKPVAAPVAAFLNGTTPTVYQLDEGHRIARGHPGIHVVPVVLALAEERGDSSGALLSALIAGYEVGVRLGRSLGGTRRDIHPHGNWGTIAAAAAAAHLLTGGDAGTIATAIDMAAGLNLHTDRTATTTGSGTHHLMPAVGADIGVLTATAAASGFTATPGCLENFMAPRSGAAFNKDLLLQGVAEGTWSEYLLATNYFKFWPACGFTHTSIGALLCLREEAGFEVSDVRAIEVRAFAAGAALGRNDDDVNDLAARYSIPCVLAGTLLDGKFWLDSLERLNDPAFRELTKLVTVVHDPALDAAYPVSGRPVVLSVELKDGRTLSKAMSVSFGDVEVPASRENLHAKATAALTHRFGPDAAERICQAACALETGGPISRLTAALRAAAEEG